MLKLLLALAHSQRAQQLETFERSFGFDFEFNRATISKWLPIKEPLNMGDGFIAGGWLWHLCRVSKHDGEIFRPIQTVMADYRFETTTIHSHAEVFGGVYYVENYGDKTITFHTSPEGIMRGTSDAIKCGDTKHYVSVFRATPGIINVQSGKLQTITSFGLDGLNLRVLDYNVNKTENIAMIARVVLPRLGCHSPIEASWLDEVH